MNIILLSGGSGKRLWPLSNDVRSKQFIKIFEKEDGELDSMLTRVYGQIMQVDSEASITIATSRKQASMIKNQLGEKVDICVEPERRDTFPAICLAARYLHDVKGVSKDEVVVVCPVDPYVESTYFEAIKELCEAAKGESNISLLGIHPTYPSAKYGYIFPGERMILPENNHMTIENKNILDQNISLYKVDSFKEKPDEETAKTYIEQGALWNGGVFAFKLSYILDKAKEILSYDNYDELYKKYASFDKISFDYAVVEKEKNIQVLEYDGEWKDLGSWNTFIEAMSHDTLGNVVMGDGCQSTSVVNELNIPILCMGCEDMVVAASADGILISAKNKSAHIKPYVEQVIGETMYAEKSWGSYTVMDVQEDSMTIKILLHPNQKMNYHSHDHRDEVWTIVSGEGTVIVDGMEQPVKSGDVITMEAGCRHTIIAKTSLQVVEVQLGQNISVQDKHKYDMPI